MPIVLDWRPQIDWAHEFTVKGGLDAQRQHNVPQRYHIVKRLRGVAVPDWDFDLDTQDTYPRMQGTTLWITDLSRIEVVVQLDLQADA